MSGPLPVPRELCVLRERSRNDAHVRLAVHGFGTDGQRPLLGNLVVTHEEFAWLADAFVAAQRGPDATRPASGPVRARVRR